MPQAVWGGAPHPPEALPECFGVGTSAQESVWTSLSHVFFKLWTFSIQIHLKVPSSFNTLILTISSSDSNQFPPPYRYKSMSVTMALKWVLETGFQAS